METLPLQSTGLDKISKITKVLVVALSIKVIKLNIFTCIYTLHNVAYSAFLDAFFEALMQNIIRKVVRN